VSLIRSVALTPPTPKSAPQGRPVPTVELGHYRWKSEPRSGNSSH
jgi:hypothetical protein